MASETIKERSAQFSTTFHRFVTVLLPRRIPLFSITQGMIEYVE